MACKFYDSTLGNATFLINLSPWITFQGDNISEDLFKEIKEALSQDFDVGSDQDLINGIKKYIELFSTNEELNNSLYNSLDKISNKDIKIEPPVNENYNPDPIVNTIENNVKTIEEDETITDEDRDLASKEFVDQLNRSRKAVTFNEEIKSNRDLITKFQNNISLYNRFVKKFGKDIFRLSFLDLNNGTIVRNYSELNNNIADYKQQLVNDITKFLNIQDVPLYSESGEFNSVEYASIIQNLVDYYNTNDPTQKLNSINNLLFTKLSPSNQSYLNAYNAYITLENFDNLLNIITDGLVTVDPYTIGIKNINRNTIKYFPFTKNALRQHFRVNEDSNIVRETTTLTKAIIQSIPLLDSKGNWDGITYMTLDKFNNAINRLGSPELKTSKKYPSLKLAKLNPTVAYTEFFNSLFVTDGRTDSAKVSKLKKNKDFQPDVQRALLSIYSYIFDRSPQAKSLYNIVQNNIEDLNFNYFLDILAYINKQSGSEYVSYKYNPDSKEYEIETFSNLTYESSLFNYERNLAEYVDSIARNGDSENTTLNILRTKYNVKLNQNSATITIGTRTLDINDKLNSVLESPLELGVDLNKELLNSIVIPNPTQVSAILNGESLSENLMNGFELLNLLQLATDIPFINTSGQLYSILRDQYNNVSEARLKGDLLGFLYNTLKTINFLDSIYNKYSSSGVTRVDITPENFIKAIKNSRQEYKTLPDFKFNKFFTSNKLAPRFKVNLSSDGDRSAIFKSIVSSLNLINGESSPSVYKNSSGDNVPSIGLMNLVKNIHEFITTTKYYQNELLKTNPTIKNIFSRNVFYNNPELIQGVSLKTEFVTPKGTVIQKNKFNIAEYGVTSVILDYYKNLTSETTNYIEFQPTVYADKANQSLIRVSKSLKINGKPLNKVTAQEIEQEHFISEQTHYTNVLSNIFNTYKRIAAESFMTDLVIEDITNIKDPKEKARVVQSNIDNINNFLSENWNNIENASSILSTKDPNFKFILETHYSPVRINGKTVYRINPFIENMARIYQISTTDKSHYESFMKRSRDIFIGDIENKNIEVNTDVFKFLQTDQSVKSWIGKDGYMAIIKDGELNPIFDKFFALNNYLSAQFLQVSVGEPYAHPAKVKDTKFLNSDGSVNEFYYIRDHANRVLAQYKRMVVMQATIHNYYQMAFEGTAPTLNVAVIEDEKAPVFNPSGDSDRVDALDGSMECTPFQNVLENNSMFSSSAGSNRKNFGYNIDPETGSGLLMKCAIFSITNNRMRISPEKKTLLRKMSDKAWDINLNLMRDENGNPRTLDSVVSNDLYYYDPNVGKYYKILNITSISDSEPLYTIFRVEVNEKGQDLNKGVETITRGISSNYELWESLGGEYSFSLDTSNPLDPKLSKEGDFGENSVNATVEFMNKTFIYKTQEDFEGRGSNLDISEFPKTRAELFKDGRLKNILDQNIVYQPMKHSDIHYLANTTSIKVGAANINPSQSRYSNYPLKSMRIGSQFFGIQMDADHHADESTVTESTQIISTLAANGYTQNLTDSAYRALGTVVEATLRNYLKAQNQAKSLEQLNSLGEYNKTLLYKALAKAAIRAFSGSANTDNTISGYLDEAAREFESSLNNELFNAKDLVYKIPFSSGSIHGSFITMLASKMNSDSIKRTFSGMGAVMVPSYGSIKYYEFDGSEGLVDQNGKVLTGHYSEFDLNRIANKAGYYSDGSSSALERYLNTGNLLVTTEPYNLVPEDIIVDDNGNNIVIDTYDKYKKYKNSPTPLLLNKRARKDLAPFRATWDVEDVDYTFSIYDHPLVEDIYNLRSKGASKEEILLKQHEINKYIGLLDNNIMLLDSRMPLYDQLISDPDLLVDLGNGQQGIRISNLNIKRAQCVVSKVFKSAFWLESGDSIPDILNSDGAYFRNKLLATYNKAKNTDNADIIFLRNNLNNTKVLFNTDYNAGYINTLKPLEILTENIDGSLYRLDLEGNPMYKVDNLSFYQDNLSGVVQEIIVVNPSDLGILSSVFNSEIDYSGVYYKFSNNNVLDITKYINTVDTNLAKRLELDTVSTEDIPNLITILDSKYMQIVNSNINRQATKMARSFEESLRVTANRIPAQAFQSIMTMDVVGFSDSDSNEVYVSRSQTWLNLGSH